jgi:hypothetical protein
MGAVDVPAAPRPPPRALIAPCRYPQAPPPAAARAERASCRARRRGSGVRARRAAARVTAVAVSRSVRQPGCTTIGRAPARVRSRRCDLGAPESRGTRRARIGTRLRALDLKRSVGHPMLGRSSTAPRWRTSPAARGWSRPMSLAITTSRATRPKSTGASHAPIDHIRRIDRAQPSEVEQKLRRTPASTTRRTKALHAGVEGLADRVGSPQRVGRSAGPRRLEREASRWTIRATSPRGWGGVRSATATAHRWPSRSAARSGSERARAGRRARPSGAEGSRSSSAETSRMWSRRGWGARRRNRRHVRPSAHRGLRGSFCPLHRVERSVCSRWWS